MAERKRKPKVVWVTRDDRYSGYILWTKKPEWKGKDELWHRDDSDFAALCPLSFEKFTGYHLEGGPDSIFAWEIWP